MRDATLTDALAACERLRLSTPVEQVPVDAAAGRILADDVRAVVDLPTFDCSAMDGYAVRSEDTPSWLRIVGEHRAGHGVQVSIGTGEAARISTGAMLPEGADAIVRLEEARLEGEVVEVPEVAAGRDVRSQGEVIMRGVMLLPAGTVVPASAVTALGAIGLHWVPVLRRPRVAVIGLGDELVSLGAALRPGQVYDANRVGVAAQAAAAGGEVISSISIGDDRDATLQAIRNAIGAGADLVVTVGGVSAGDHDHVRPAMRALAAEEVFRGVRLVPCRPAWLGVREHVVTLGLPGNPASAAIAFHVFGRALLGRPATWQMRAPLGTDWHPRPGMTEALRCGMRGGVLYPLASQAAHAVTTMAMADALALVDRDVRAGEQVPWTPLTDG